MATKAEEQGVAPSDVHASTPTLAESGSPPQNTDAEKQVPAGPPAIPGAPFPDGGLRAWAAVAGAWLAGESGFLRFKPSSGNTIDDLP